MNDPIRTLNEQETRATTHGGLIAMLSPLVLLYRVFRGPRVSCPHCLEPVRVGASVCPHCQRDIDL